MKFDLIGCCEMCERIPREFAKCHHPPFEPEDRNEAKYVRSKTLRATSMYGLGKLAVSGAVRL